jgi:tetratricopeptide (TPR) repeat protein
MEEWLKIKLEKADEFIEKEEFNSAIRLFIESLELTEDVDELLQIRNSLAYLYQTLGDQEKAIQYYQDALVSTQEKEDLDVFDEENIAHLYSSLAHSHMLMEQNEEAKKCLLESISNYEKCYALNSDLKAFLALSRFNLATLYLQEVNGAKAKNELKAAAALYEELLKEGKDQFRPYAANTYGSLAGIYEDESDLYTAYVNHRKASEIFKLLVNEDENMYLPYLASTYNNMAICQKQLDQPEKALALFTDSLAIYKKLSAEAPEEFLPFLASNYNSLGVLYTDLDAKEKGIEYYLNALAIYTDLSERYPEEFMHYKATCLHNLGVINDENKDYATALDYYMKAQEIRIDLANKEASAFTLDLCVTMLNMVTLYHSRMEIEKDNDLKNPAMELLEDVERRLFYIEDYLPVIKSMKSDVEYFKEFFTETTY